MTVEELIAYTSLFVRCFARSSRVMPDLIRHPSARLAARMSLFMPRIRLRQGFGVTRRGDGLRVKPAMTRRVGLAFFENCCG